MVVVLLYSCGFSQQHGNSNNEHLDHYAESDSITLAAYKYKKQGNNKSESGDKEGAIDDYTQAIMIKPTYDTAYYNRGVVKAHIGRYKDAILDYNEVVKINPYYAKAYYSRANSKKHMGDKKGALKDYNKAIELSPAIVEPYINQGVLKSEMGNNEAAIADFRLAIKNCAPNADIYNNLGRALYDLERFKESAEAYGEGIKYFPEDYRLYYGRGLARKRTGDKNGACEDWIKSSELGCIQANMLLPLCDEYIKEKNDSLNKQKEEANKIQ